MSVITLPWAGVLQLKTISPLEETVERDRSMVEDGHRSPYECQQKKMSWGQDWYPEWQDKSNRRFSVTLDGQLSPYQHHMKVRNVVCVSVTTWILLSIPMWIHLHWSDEPKPCLLLYWQLLISPISHFSNMSFCCWSAGLHVTPSTEGCRDVSNKPNPTLAGVDAFKVTPIKWIKY